MPTKKLRRSNVPRFAALVVISLFHVAATSQPVLSQTPNAVESGRDLIDRFVTIYRARSKNYIVMSEAYYSTESTGVAGPQRRNEERVGGPHKRASKTVLRIAIKGDKRRIDGRTTHMRSPDYGDSMTVFHHLKVSEFTQTIGGQEQRLDGILGTENNSSFDFPAFVFSNLDSILSGTHFYGDGRLTPNTTIVDVTEPEKGNRVVWLKLPLGQTDTKRSCAAVTFTAFDEEWLPTKVEWGRQPDPKF